MRYSTLLFVLMATLSSGLVLEKRETRTVNATNIEAASVQGCFPRGGERWGADRGYAYKYATRACAEALVGSYRPEDQRVKCYNLSSLKKVDFALELRADVVARGIDFPECYVCFDSPILETMTDLGRMVS